MHLVMIRALSYAVAGALAACGGGARQPTTPTPGTTHATPADGAEGTTAGGETGATGATTTPGGTTEPVPQGPPPPVTFELRNDGDRDLTFTISTGWQPVIFAYTGKPPKAKPAILFPTHCTASCDSPPETICPVCPEPKNKKEEAEMTKLEVVPAGSSVRVPWDGKVVVYQKTKGKPRCRCFRRADPAPATYTVKACGLRPPKETGKPSQPVCTETQVSLPLAEMPGTITLSFSK